MLSAERLGEVLRETVGESGRRVRTADLARWSGYTLRSAHRWVAGEAVMPLEAFVSIMATCPIRALTDALSGLIFENTQRLVVLVQDLGEAPASEATDASPAAALRRVADLVERHEQALDDGRIDGRELLGIIEAARAAQRCLERVVVVSQRNAGRRAPRLCSGSTRNNLTQEASI